MGSMRRPTTSSGRVASCFVSGGVFCRLIEARRFGSWLLILPIFDFTCLFRSHRIDVCLRLGNSRGNRRWQRRLRMVYHGRGGRDFECQDHHHHRCDDETGGCDPLPPWSPVVSQRQEGNRYPHCGKHPGQRKEAWTVPSCPTLLHWRSVLFLNLAREPLPYDPYRDLQRLRLLQRLRPSDLSGAESNWYTFDEYGTASVGSL
jgi:hypothetical protein